MAINPATQYPGKIDTSDPDGYPYGKAQNVAVSGDGTGTPWEKALINDLFGLGQALLSEAGITPTGTPDKVGASQYLDAILGLKRKNYIINPSMAVSQENGDGPTIVGSTPIYVADEVTAANTSGTGSLTGTRGAAGGLRTVKVTAGSAVTDLSGVKIAGRFERRFETQNVLGLNSKTVVYSAKITTNFSGKIPIAFRRIAPTRTYIVDVDVVSGENTVAVVVPFEANTVSGDADGLGFQMRVAGCNEGTFQTSTTGVWQDGDFISTDQSTQWVKSAGDFVEITAEKLEEGTVPSAFEPNSYATDLAECQRYYFEGAIVGYKENVASGETIGVPANMPGMRAAPVASFQNVATNIGGAITLSATSTNLMISFVANNTTVADIDMDYKLNARL